MSRYDQNEAVESYSELWRRSDDSHDRLLTIERFRLIGVKMHPVWQNGWGDSSDTADEPYTFALVLGGNWLMTQGYAEGGSSGTVAYTLPYLWRPAKNRSWNGHVVTTGHVPASFDCLASTGEVTINF